MNSPKILLFAMLLPASLMAAALSGTVVSSPGVVVAGAKVIVYNNAGLTVKQDSAVTDASGTYSVMTLNSGFSWLVASKVGYHNSASVQRTNSATGVTGITVTMPIDDSSSTIAGRVLRASDSTPAIGAVVTFCCSSPLDSPRIDSTDSAGFFLFEKVGTATGYNVSASYPGFLSASAGNIAVGWNSTTTVGTFFLIRPMGTIAGVVRRADTTSKVIVGAKMIFYFNNLKVDSVISDSLGNYSLQLNATTYTVKSGAVGYRGNKGTLTRDTTVAINFGATTNLLVYLTPASGTIGGTVTHGMRVNPPLAAGPLDSATIYVERRIGTTATLNTWIVLDSTISQAGFYQFTGLIPATSGSPTLPVPASGTGPTPGGNYRILAKAKGWGANYNETQGLLLSPTPLAVVVLPFAPNSTVTSNINFQILFEPILFSDKARGNIRVSIIGDRLLMDLGLSNLNRTVEVYDLKGSLQHSVLVPIGESKAVMPTVYAKGFVFKVR